MSERTLHPPRAIEASDLQQQLGRDRFTIKRQLGQGGMGAVYQAFDQAHNQEVALKTLLAANAEGLYSFKQEFRSLADVVHPNLVTLYELLVEGDLWFFSMELIEGSDFLSYVRQGRGPVATASASGSQPSTTGRGGSGGRAPLLFLDVTIDDCRAAEDPTATVPPLGAAESDKLTASVAMALRSAPSPGPPGVAVGPPQDPAQGRVYAPADPALLRAAMRQLAEALGALHGSGHLHRDIKPSNVMVTSAGRVIVLDFGVTVPLARAAADAKTEDGERRSQRVVGTPLYLAPEQLKAGYAPAPPADWYAIGVMLYQALSGYRPYVGEPVEILRAKLGRDPPSIDELAPEMPADLRDLCSALLRRDPARRPGGEEVVRRLTGHGATGVGLRWLSSSVEDAELLVGRDEELASLREAWTDMSDGASVSVLVQGRSGMGKSLLVQRFLDGLSETDTNVLSGRCYAQETVPYKALDSLVDALCRHLAALPGEEVVALLPADTAALSRAFPVLLRLPEVEARARQRRESDGGESSELRRRAFSALRQLLSALARRTPLVLHIDDLQFGDVDSAPFVASLIEQRSVPILFITSFRSEEIDSSPLLVALFGEGKANLTRNPAVRRVMLDQLPDDRIRTLARHLLGREEATPHTVEAVAREAEGNPHFVHELVRYATSAALPAVSLRDLSLLAVILARAQQLSQSAQQLLRTLAVAGFRMRAALAWQAAGLQREDQRALAELRAGRFVKTTGTREYDVIEPYHDSVRVALYDSLGQAARRGIHASIAETLDAHPELAREQLFAHATHYFLGRPDEKESRVFELNLQAGRVAAESYAYEQAYLHVERAKRVADELGRPLDTAFYQHFADTCAHTGRVELAFEHYKMALAHSTDRLERAQLRWGVSKVHMAGLDTKAARAETELAFAEIDRKTPSRGLLAIVVSLLAFLKGWAILTFSPLRRPLAAQQRREQKILAQIYVHLGYVAYFLINPLLIVQCTLRMLVPAALLGSSRELIQWRLLAGSALAMGGFRAPANWLLQGAKRDSARLRDAAVDARLAMFEALWETFLGDAHRAYQLMSACLRTHGPYLENQDYLTGMGDLVWNLMMRGHAQEAWQWLQQGLRREALGGQRTMVAKGHTYQTYAGPLLAVLGRMQEGTHHLDLYRDFIAPTPADRFRWARYLGDRGLLLVEIGDVGSQLEAALDAYAALEINPKGVPHNVAQGFVAAAYARVMQLERCDVEQRPIAISRCRAALKRLRKAARHPILRCHLHLVEGRFHEQSGRAKAARKAFESARTISLAIDNRWVQFELLLREVAALRRTGQTESARVVAETADALVTDNGWGEHRRRRIWQILRV